MSFDQVYLLTLLVVVLVLFVWGRLRHDVVAMIALLAVVVAGQVSAGDAFSGFANPATVTVALLLIISRGLMNSGAVSMIARRAAPSGDSKTGQIGILTSIGGALSSFMNNVGALGIMMPAAIKLGSEKKISPSLLLMPLAFGSILGGLITLIGTPPNIIIAAFRAETLGESYEMFDFAPVGLPVAVAGILFIALIGWRLIPRTGENRTTAEELFQLDNYITEATVPDEHALIGKSLMEIDEIISDQDAVIIGLLRGQRRLDPATRRTLLRTGDIILIEAASPEDVNETLTLMDLRPPPPPEDTPDSEAEAGTEEKSTRDEAADEPEEKKEEKRRLIGGADVAVIEAVVQQGARIIGRTMGQSQLRSIYGVNLLAVARQGRPYRGRIRDFKF